MESTAIVGDPQIGKSSLLKYILSELTLNSRYRQVAKILIPVEIDVYASLLSEKKKPFDFWQQVFDVI
jgi:hypothetical protein